MLFNICFINDFLTLLTFSSFLHFVSVDLHHQDPRTIHSKFFQLSQNRLYKEAGVNNPFQN